MTTAELKMKIFRQIDSLEKNRLEEFYGIVLNFINGSNSVEDWDELTVEQKQGIYHAIDEIESGKGVLHDEVMTKIHQKYPNV